MKPLLRITITLTAIFIGYALMYGLTYVGKKTQGPIDAVLTSAGDIVRETEERIILEKRSNKRTESFSGFGRSAIELRNPKKILLGAADENINETLQPILAFEKSLQSTFPLVQIYTAWGSKENQAFPKIQVESILKSGSIPVITWEPWLTDFDDEQLPIKLRPIETRDKNGLADIAAGFYDQYLRIWAQAAAKVEMPIFLRLGHEMNDPYRYPWGPQNNPATDYVAAWQHVHDVFLQENAKNVLWVWSPHPAHGWFKEYFPGSAYVDWVGVGALNYGTVAAWSEWWTFDEIFGKYYPELAAFGKPIMICEFGSLAVGGDRKQWYVNALNSLPRQYPNVKSLLFFNFSKDQTTTQQSLDWTIKNDTAIIRGVADAIKKW